MSASPSPTSPNGAAARPRHRLSPSGSHLSMTSKPQSVAKSSDDDQKTAVKVAIRLRPPPALRDPGFETIPQRFRGSACQVTNPTTLTVESGQGKKQFTFDRVFPHNEKQEGIWDYVSDGVHAFVQGYNVSILAYGQSGAGKSYTMGTTSPGEQISVADQGIVPRAAAALFDQLLLSSSSRQASLHPSLRYAIGASPSNPPQSRGEDKNWQLKATYVEIYNEQLRDLLVSETVPQSQRGTVNIREDAKGRILITGAKQVIVNSVEDLMNALHFGSSIRQTDFTAINAKSSRSHAVFSLNLVQKTGKPGSDPVPEGRVPYDVAPGTDSRVTIDSKLHFVDLAGSERLKNSGLTGERVKEGISINAGLASLGKVISQLSSRSAGSHVSYRDSRLTRLLQDSLGGNAITYMVACINPVEFHLSETLNTVQYAQRARAIQSRPRIQQRTDEGEKQLIIDRLRSEVAYLRDQIRVSEQSERRNTSHQDRTGRKQAREDELQNQLLDAQENYSALSQRHAKLVAEFAEGKDEDRSQLPAFDGALKKNSLERLNRSNTFAEAVEHVVLEYEKTIQSLESSLSTTRSSLSTSETALLEREAKIVYMEAVTQQLQSRVQKSIDREAHSEAYMRELESKLDGMESGEDRHLVIIQELREELAKMRESETSAEDYISTLEERLVEAEQDSDLMQREINRLEHVVQRQRGIGKLDHMLKGLESVGHDEDKGLRGIPALPFKDTFTADAFHDRLVATTSGVHPNEELLPETAEAEWKTFGPMEGEDDTASQYTADTEGLQAVNGIHSSSRAPFRHTHGEEKVHSPAQAKAIADKLETMTMELFDLRVDHESTLTELDDVSRKYQMALNTLAELQDAVDEARQTRPTSFLEHGGPHESREDGQPSSSRMLSSELSSLGESPTLVETSDGDISISDKIDHRHVVRVMQKEETLAEAIRGLKRANAEKDINISELTENYSQLQDQHNDTLNYIEELKEEIHKGHTPVRNLAESQNESKESILLPDTGMMTSYKAALLESKKQVAALHDLHTAQEKELSAKIDSFNATLAKHVEFVSALPAKPLGGTLDSTEESDTGNEVEARPRITELQGELSHWKSYHQDSSSSMHNLQQQLMQTISGLESSFDNIESMLQIQLQSKLEYGNPRHKEEIATLQRQVTAQGKKFTQLENSYAQMMREVERDGKARALTEKELQKHRDLVVDLEDKIDQQKSLATFHQQGLKSMQESHAREVDGINARVQELSALNEETLRQLEMSLQKERRSSRMALELEGQLANNTILRNRPDRADVEREVEEYRGKIAHLESQLADMKRMSQRSMTPLHDNSYLSTLVRQSSNTQTALPSPPPAGPLPPLPGSKNSFTSTGGGPRVRDPSPATASAHRDSHVSIAAAQQLEDYETRIRTIEKHLYAEKQLTQTLEEALVDLETQNNRTKADTEAWKRKCRELEEEASGLRRERGSMRNSLQAVEEERDRRIRAEQARRQLEERMEALGKKRKGRGLNCF